MSGNQPDELDIKINLVTGQISTDVNLCAPFLITQGMGCLLKGKI